MADYFQLKFEFFGIPRLRAGVAEFFVQLPTAKNTLGEALEVLRSSLPSVDQECFDGEKLKKEYMLNISGERFTKSFDTLLSENDSVLLLSSDVGG